MTNNLKSLVVLLLLAIPATSFAIVVSGDVTMYGELGKVSNFPENRAGDNVNYAEYMIIEPGYSYECYIKENKKDFANSFTFTTSCYFSDGVVETKQATFDSNRSQASLVKPPGTCSSGLAELDITRANQFGNESINCFKADLPIYDSAKKVSIPFQNEELISTKDHINGLAFTYDLNDHGFSEKSKKIVCKIINTNDSHYYGAWIIDLAQNNEIISHFYETNEIILTTKPLSEKSFSAMPDHKVDIIHVDPHGSLQVSDTNYDKGTGRVSCSYEDE